MGFSPYHEAMYIVSTSQYQSMTAPQKVFQILRALLNGSYDKPLSLLLSGLNTKNSQSK